MTKKEMYVRKLIKEEIKKVLKETYPFKQNLDADDYYGEVQGALMDIFSETDDDSYNNTGTTANKKAIVLITKHSDIVDDGYRSGTNPEDIADQLAKFKN